MTPRTAELTAVTPGRRDPMTEFDLIVVGSGTAGCAVARRLAERTDLSCLLIEAGPAYPGWALNAPLASLRLRKHWSWPSETVPQEHLLGRKIELPMGRVAGGTSAVNAMIAVPGPAADFDQWAANGCPGWAWNDLQPGLERAASRSGNAMLLVSDPAYISDFSRAFLTACEQAGIRRVPSLTGSDSETCGFFPVFQRNARRESAANYLAASIPGNRLQLITRTEVRRVLFKAGRAVGVELGGRTQGQKVVARRGVLICAGTLLSPRILQCSGIGPADLLTTAGINVEVDSNEVGLNLQDHVRAPVLMESTALSPGRKSQWLPAAIRYLLGQRGVMASNCCEAGCFLGQPGQSPDIEIITLFQTIRAPRAIELMAVLMHPESRGTVQIDPANPFGPPRIDPRYLSAPKDVDLLMDGIARIRDIVKQPALKQFGVTREILPAHTDLRRFLQAEASTCHHPTGTCRMGQDPASVVDPELRVRGVENLWVADCSIIPSIPSSHTAMTAMMIGERAAELLEQQLNKS